MGWGGLGSVRAEAVARIRGDGSTLGMLESLTVPAQERNSSWTMVVLHGLGDSLAGYRWLPEALGLPWLGYRLVNAPDHYFGGYSWYDFAGNPGPGVERSRGLLVDLLERQVAEGIPSERTFVLGFSQGCLMTLEVGARYPRRLAGCVGISGYVHEPDRLLNSLSPVARDQRFLVTHGDADPLIPLGPVRGQIERLKAAGLNITWREFAKEHTIAGEEELAVIREFLESARKHAAAA